MQKKQILKGSLVSAATLSMLAACGPAPNTGTNPSPSPSASATAEPTAAPTAEPTAAPTAEPTAAPTAEPTAAPTAEPTAAPTTEPTSAPSATATSDISVVEKTTFNGKVYDDEGSPLDGVTVKARSLNSSVPYDASTSTAGGTYAFNNAPAGVQIEITATKNGYTLRRRVEVLKSNKTGDPDANRYDFGTEEGVGGEGGEFGVGYNGLSDKPEVISVTPGRNASGVDPATSFVIKFSEPMDEETVEDNFAIYAATSELLSVDEDCGSSCITGESDDGEAVTFVGEEDAPSDGEAPDSTLVYDESDFDISWNSDDTEVTFTFADEAHLPTDTESANVPDYLVTFTGVDDGQLKDKSGVTRDEGDEGYFKLTDGDFEMWYEFSVDTDEEEPQVLSVDVTVDDNSQDEIRIEFSEPMMLNTRAGQIMGLDNDDNTGSDTGDGTASESPLDADNYSFEVQYGNNDPIDAGTFYENTGGGAVNNIRFDSDDESNSTVLIQFSTGALDFTSGDRVYVTVDRNVVDPAGNSIDTSNDDEDDVAN